VSGASGGVTSTSNSIKYCYLGDVGGAFYIKNSFLTDSGSTTMSYNAAISGGAINCHTCVISLTNTIFNNHQGYNGGLIYLYEQVTVTLNNINVNTASADNNGGMIYATQTTSPVSTVTFSNTATLTGFSAANNGGAFYINNK
jgi:predicted outer membrane repeat protein